MRMYSTTRTNFGRRRCSRSRLLSRSRAICVLDALLHRRHCLLRDLHPFHAVPTFVRRRLLQLLVGILKVFQGSSHEFLKSLFTLTQRAFPIHTVMFVTTPRAGNHNRELWS